MRARCGSGPHHETDALGIARLGARVGEHAPAGDDGGGRQCAAVRVRAELHLPCEDEVLERHAPAQDGLALVQQVRLDSRQILRGVVKGDHRLVATLAPSFRT